MALLESFGPLIGRLRVARNLSQEKLAQLSGLHATTISDVECGKTRVVLDTLEALARGLGIEPGELVTMAANELQTTHQLRFSIVMERTAAGYSAYCPDLPGCAATGDSREEVERAMRAAITAELETRRRVGSPIPEPASYTTVISVPL